MNYRASQRPLLQCHECGCNNLLPDIAGSVSFSCGRCGGNLLVERADWQVKTSALTLTGVILFILTMTCPFIGLSVAGQIHTSGLLAGVGALWERQEYLLSVLVFLTIFLFPLLELLTVGYLLLVSKGLEQKTLVRATLRLIAALKPWSMLEIFLLGVLVTAIKIAEMAEVVPGVGFFSFCALVVVLTAIKQSISEQQLWRLFYPDNHFVARTDEALYSCHSCSALIGESVLAEQQSCPRCQCGSKDSHAASFQHTLALLIAASILYVPAMLLPILNTTNFGVQQSDTIVSGAIHLLEAGSWPVALVVFVASILVPIAKLLVMFWLLWTVYHGHERDRKQRTQMYRVTEFVGRWSMVDVFVVTLLVAMVQFGLLANIEPGPATLAFAAVVVLTMLAAETFDPKMIWHATPGWKQSG